VTATKKAGAQAACTLPNQTWEIDVFNLEWAAGFAGGFTLDWLTDPIFELDSGDQDGTMGAFVRRNRPAQDSTTLGLAAMVHLFHTNPDFLGGRGVNWAPLSFGLGINDDSEARYFVGSSLHFQNKLYLTVGAVFGEEDRLPNGLHEGDFTTERNALATLDQRTDSAFFFALSYAFIDTAEGHLKKAFSVRSPKPD
jgi:hypothetical protein